MYINNFPPLLQNQCHPDEIKVVLTGPKGLRVFEFWYSHSHRTPKGISLCETSSEFNQCC